MVQTAFPLAIFVQTKKDTETSLDQGAVRLVAEPSVHVAQQALLHVQRSGGHSNVPKPRNAPRHGLHSQAKVVHPSGADRPMIDSMCVFFFRSSCLGRVMQQCSCWVVEYGKLDYYMKYCCFFCRFWNKYVYGCCVDQKNNFRNTIETPGFVKNESNLQMCPSSVVARMISPATTYLWASGSAKSTANFSIQTMQSFRADHSSLP